MKKFKKSIALLAAAALVTGGLFLSCSNSSDDDDESTEEVLNSSGNEADNSGNTGDTTGDSGSSTVSETTYNFVGLSETDFSGVTLDKTTVSGYWVFTGEAAVSNGASIYSKSLKNARIGYDDSNVTTKINFNGDGLSNSAVTEGSTVSSCSRYVSVPVTAAGTIVVNCQGSSKDNLGKLVVYDDSTKSVLSAVTVTAEAADYSVSVSTATTVCITYSREGMSSGGLHVLSVKYTPAN